MDQKCGATANAGTQIAEFAFDYSPFGIPPAPGSSDTLGLRLRANVPPDTTRPAGVTSGLSMSPTGQNFGTNYSMQFYAWSNFNGAANANGPADNGASEGGTNNVMFAVGTAGNVPLVVANTGLVTNGQMDGIGFATTGDGGIVNDYRVYPKSATLAPVSAMTANSYGKPPRFTRRYFPRCLRRPFSRRCRPLNMQATHPTLRPARRRRERLASLGTK